MSTRGRLEPSGRSLGRPALRWLAPLLVAVLASACGGSAEEGSQQPAAREGAAKGQCFDGADNDGDGLVDCADPDCGGVTCRAAAGPCDLPAACAGGVCPPNPFRPAGSEVCRPAAGPCDVEETCDGASAACPADAKRPAGTDPESACGLYTCDGAGGCFTSCDGRDACHSACKRDAWCAPFANACVIDLPGPSPCFTGCQCRSNLCIPLLFICG
jgi:hypothetical protein